MMHLLFHLPLSPPLVTVVFASCGLFFSVSGPGRAFLSSPRALVLSPLPVSLLCAVVVLRRWFGNSGVASLASLPRFSLSRVCAEGNGLATPEDTEGGGTGETAHLAPRQHAAHNAGEATRTHACVWACA